MYGKINNVPDHQPAIPSHYNPIVIPSPNQVSQPCRSSPCHKVGGSWASWLAKPAGKDQNPENEITKTGVDIDVFLLLLNFWKKITENDQFYTSKYMGLVRLEEVGGWTEFHPKLEFCVGKQRPPDVKKWELMI